jgi:hypothetical protein
MNPYPPKASRPCRWFFIALEVLLALSWTTWKLESHLAAREIWSSDIIATASSISVAVTTLFLFFIIPWFWGSLRQIALIGWLLALCSLIAFLQPR